MADWLRAVYVLFRHILIPNTLLSLKYWNRAVTNVSTPGKDVEWVTPSH